MAGKYDTKSDSLEEIVRRKGDGKSDAKTIAFATMAGAYFALQPLYVPSALREYYDFLNWMTQGMTKGPGEDIEKLPTSLYIGMGIGLLADLAIAGAVFSESTSEWGWIIPVATNVASSIYETVRYVKEKRYWSNFNKSTATYDRMHSRHDYGPETGG